MKSLCYVAGKFEDKEEVRRAQRMVREIGYEITHDWTTEDATGLEGPALSKFLEGAALCDYYGVFAADVILALNHEKAFGTMVEIGLALAWNKTVYLVGPEVRDNIFWHLPPQKGIRLFNSLEDAIKALEEDDRP